MADLIMYGNAWPPGAGTLVARFGGRAGRTRGHDARLVTRAAATPARDVFERIAFVQDGGLPSRPPAAAPSTSRPLRAAPSIEGGPVTQCDAGVMQRASLVVMATRSDRPSWGITDPVAKVLGACQRPVLFIPAR